MRKYVRKITTIIGTTLISSLLLTSLASAHVTVNPAKSNTGAWETYTMKVPTEKDIPTVKISLKIPDQAELEQYQPLVGWTVTEDKDANDKVKSITWEADKGGGIQPRQFQQFSFVVKNPTTAGSLDWNAYQYYSDGTVVEWTGDTGADKPHSITQIMDAAASLAPASPAPSEAPVASSDVASSASSAATSSSGNTLNIVSLIIAIVALIVAVAALSRRRK